MPYTPSAKVLKVTQYLGLIRTHVEAINAVAARMKPDDPELALIRTIHDTLAGALALARDDASFLTHGVITDEPF